MTTAAAMVLLALVGGLVAGATGSGRDDSPGRRPGAGVGDPNRRKSDIPPAGVRVAGATELAPTTVPTTVVPVPGTAVTAAPGSPAGTTATSAVTTTSATAATAPAPVTTVPPSSSTTAAPPKAAAPPPTSAFAASVVSSINAERAARGLPLLEVNGALVGCAQGWSDHLAEIQALVHSGLGCAGAVTGNAGENIYVGKAPSAGAVVGAWLASGPHRDVMLHVRFRFVGVGVAVSADGRAWVTANFA